MMPLGKAGSPQDTLTEVVVSSLKWMKLGALGAGTQRTKRSKRERHTHIHTHTTCTAPPGPLAAALDLSGGVSFNKYLLSDLSGNSLLFNRVLCALQNGENLRLNGC